MTSVFADFSTLEEHGSQIGMIKLKIKSDGQGGYVLTGTDLGADNGDIDLTKLHGWLFWIGWGLFGFIQACSNRYGKKYWRVYMWVHRIAGTFILLTIAMGLVGIRRMGW
jgi:hypothetical protein